MSGAAFVYLLHFDTPYKHAKHYAGFTRGESLEAVTARVGAHARGEGARLTAVVSKAGITWRVARTWKFDTEAGARAKEKRIKHKAAGRFCPVCSPPRRAYKLDPGEVRQ